jgi:hypothetical protein
MPLTRRHFLGASAVLGLAACAAPAAPAAPGAPAATTAPAAPGPLVDASALIDWIAANPDRASVLVDDGRGTTLSHLADRPRPIASAVKVVHLVAYAQAVADGRLDPAGPVPVADWERWYVPGADAGVHPAALEALGATSESTVTWDDVAAAMIDLSDNAAADLLLATLGEDALVAAAAAGGWGAFDVPHIAGEDLYVLAPDPAADRRASARALGRAWADGEPAARELGAQYAAGLPGGGGGSGRAAPPTEDPAWAAVVDLWDGAWAATAEDLAAVHRAAATGAFDPPVTAVVQRHLERLVADRLPEGVLGLGQKGGSLPGVLSWAGGLRRADGGVGVAVISLSRLPQQAFTELSQSGAPLLLGQQVLLDEAVLARLGEALPA